MANAIEQRTEARYSCTVPIEGKQGSGFDQTKTLDISRQGIGVLSSQQIQVNQKIALEVVLKPDTDTITVLGVVKWVRKLEGMEQYRAGLEFLEIISGSSTRLDEYFASKRLKTP
jgi:c-di-GMP-binding flagellar brake protein YcgR